MNRAWPLGLPARPLLSQRSFGSGCLFSFRRAITELFGMPRVPPLPCTLFCLGGLRASAAAFCRRAGHAYPVHPDGLAFDERVVSATEHSCRSTTEWASQVCARHTHFLERIRRGAGFSGISFRAHGFCFSPPDSLRATLGILIACDTRSMVDTVREAGILLPCNVRMGVGISAARQNARCRYTRHISTIRPNP